MSGDGRACVTLTIRSYVLVNRGTLEAVGMPLSYIVKFESACHAAEAGVDQHIDTGSIRYTSEVMAAPVLLQFSSFTSWKTLSSVTSEGQSYNIELP